MSEQTRTHFVFGRWIDGQGAGFSARDPSTGEMNWAGREAGPDQIDAAVGAAREAWEPWAGRDPAERAAYLEAFAQRVKAQADSVAEIISRETGKPLWESKNEVEAVVAKIALTRQAFAERCSGAALEIAGATGGVQYRAHGVVAVYGPFNLPAHLPNGQIAPALLAGNTVVFKPSELTPWVGQKLVEIWEDTGLPPGTLNLVQGGAPVGRALAARPGLDGIYFTGSYETGRALHQAFGGHPEKILALEMGGNNPLAVWGVADTRAAVIQIVLSAFITAGQRCTCARRLIVRSGAEGESLVERLVEKMRTLRCGPHTEHPEPFLGPVITPGAAKRLLEAQEDLVRRGGRALVPMARLGRAEALLSPGLVDMTAVSDRPDVEFFGPLLQLVRVPDFESALREANRTAYGLCAGLLADDRSHYDRFAAAIRTGVIHWNRPTTGASGRLPFGGVGISGNHRPGGYFTVDFCSHPVATLGTSRLTRPANLPPGIE